MDLQCRISNSAGELRGAAAKTCEEKMSLPGRQCARFHEVLSHGADGMMRKVSVVEPGGADVLVEVDRVATGVETKAQ